MMSYKKELRSFSFGDIAVQLWAPDMIALRHSMDEQQVTPDLAPFPYWARLWPSAIAMCRFVVAHPALISGKEVLELAAGLGLPGMVAARFAAQVTISDYAPDAVDFMASSVAHNGLDNVACRLIDWHRLPVDIRADVLLLSDVNYDPAAFTVLYDVLLGFLNRGTTIVLATPQRLMARPFIEQLLPYCIQQDELEIALDEQQTFITMLVLQRVP